MIKLSPPLHPDLRYRAARFVLPGVCEVEQVAAEMSSEELSAIAYTIQQLLPPGDIVEGQFSVETQPESAWFAMALAAQCDRRL